MEEKDKERLEQPSEQSSEPTSKPGEEPATQPAEAAPESTTGEQMDQQPVYPPPGEPTPPRRRSFVGPLILIFVGLVFLLNNLGLVGWSIWEILWRFWPVWLIAIGVDMLFGRRGRWGGLLALAIVLTMLGGAFYFTGLWVDLPGSSQVSVRQEIEQPLNGAREARVEIESGVSQLEIRGGAGPDTLIEGSVAPVGGERLDQDFQVSGSTAYYSLQSQFRGISIPFSHNGRGQGRWDLMLNERIPMALTISTGVGRSDIDLSNMVLTDLRMTSGVGETILTLPSSGQVRGRINTGVGQTTIRVPSGMAARIRVQTGVGGVSVRGDFARDGSYYTTPNYNAATHRVDLEVEGGVGGILIEQVN